MLVLGIETSTPQASVTIGSEQGIIGSCTISRGAAYGEFLLPAVEFLMHQSGLTYRQLSAVEMRKRTFGQAESDLNKKPHRRGL